MSFELVFRMQAPTMCKALAFDAQSRGAASLADAWKKDHEELKDAVWPLEDVFRDVFKPAFETAFAIYDCYRTQALSSDVMPFSYVVDSYRRLISAANVIAAEGDKLQQSYQVAGLDELKADILRLTEVVSEDDFATDAAFSGGALDE
ncbi:MAG TPA: hypothetical protein VHV55_08965 [Pirellulales bacterium]|nr:hypothetical protein [Pirellulales bacterium]